MLRLQACQCHPMNCLDRTGASPFHPNAEAVTVLAHIFAVIEGLTNTRQRTQRKPPLSSSTPSQDPATCSTSLRSPSRLRSLALHLHTTIVRTWRYQQGEFTPWKDALGLQTVTPYIARVRVSEWFRSIRPLNESCNQWLRRSTEASSREADHLRTNLPDDSALVRPTVAQNPEPGGPVKSIDMAPSRRWHLTIPENACMVSDAFPSLVSRIVAIWSPGCSLLLTDRLPLPPSAPSFPHPPDRRDDNHHHCVKQR